jgi:GDP-4-dehydro-6-deoxy-D-mannose reductase
MERVGGEIVKVLVTGATGFAGSHLVEYYLKQGAEVAITHRWRSNKENIVGFEKQVEMIPCDVVDAFSTEKAVLKAKPHVIHHLAAQSYVLQSWHAPAETLTINIMGTLNILEAARKHPCLVHIAGSSEEYGNVEASELPIKESTPLRPVSPYAVSKVAADMLGWQYSKSYKYPVLITRAFNHTGPRRGEVFVSSHFTRQLVEIAKGLKPPVLTHGDLSSERDWTDVRDIVRGYAMAVKWMRDNYIPNEPYRVNLCSSQCRSVASVLAELLTIAKLQDSVELKTDPARIRPSDVHQLVGDNLKALQDFGWKPEIPWSQTLAELYQYWWDRICAK